MSWNGIFQCALGIHHHPATSTCSFELKQASGCTETLNYARGVMAKLHRMVRLDDRQDTSVFTFLVPCTSLLQRSSLQDNFARDFDHGCHRWTFNAARSPSHVDLMVTLKSCSRHVSVEVDLAFTLINQDHYTKNEKGRVLGARYSVDCETQGLKNFCSLDDLDRGNFRALQGTGWFIIELEMKNQKSFFEQMIKLSEGPEKGAKNRGRYETAYFSFGNFDWNLLLFPKGDSSEVDGRFVTSINRLSSFDNICKMKYDVSVEISSTSSSSFFQSDGTLESIVDVSGKSRLPHQLQRQHRQEGNISKGGIFSFRSQTSSGSSGTLNIRVVLRSCSVVGEAVLRPFVVGRNRVRMYDREEQAWTIETDVSVERLILRLFYDDVSHVPRGHVRRVTWSVSVLPAIGHSLSAISGDLVSTGGSTQVRGGGGNLVVGETRSCYYVQTDVDDGQSVTTDISTAELKHSGVYLEEKDGGQMTLHLEWIDSHLLFMDRWQLSDDVIVKQRHQLRQELASLEAENLALEKQVHSYQISLARNATHAGTGQVNHDGRTIGDVMKFF